jgi:hypothetical protein
MKNHHMTVQIDIVPDVVVAIDGVGIGVVPAVIVAMQTSQ